MAIRGLDHVNISTAKLAETRAFFIEVLGLEEGWRPPFPFDGAWLYAGGRDVVHLAEVSGERQPSRAAALDHFAFEIDDFDDARQRLDAAGIAYRASESPAGGIRQLFLTELNGATVELNWRPA
jgi:catechol 2,3-dioxygenase-like lactoylglutathione lyase family enzyme